MIRRIFDGLRVSPIDSVLVARERKTENMFSLLESLRFLPDVNKYIVFSPGNNILSSNSC